MKPFLLKSILASLLVAVSAVASAQVLRVSAIPDEAPTELQRKFKPLGDYLKQETGLEVQFTPVTDSAAVVEGLANEKIDLAWLGGFTFVQAKLRTQGGAQPIVQRAEDEKFTSRFIVPVASTARTLQDLKGKTFVFGSPSSTSGHLMPRFFLNQVGIRPETDFKAVAFSGAHDATAHGGTDRLMPEAHAQDGQPPGEMADGLDAHAGLRRRAGSGRQHQLVGLEVGDALHRDLVVAEHPHVLTQLGKVLHEVEGEAVVVVDHQQHVRSPPRRARRP